jgi:flagellar biosynthesis protein FlhG
VNTQDPLILSIGGGKGGVGKSMVSANLAVQYAQAGCRVVLIDLDIGAANLHTLFGLRKPPKGLGEYFTTPRRHLNEYILETPVANLSLVAGSGFMPELANIKHAQKVKIISQIKELDADLILLDLGAGSSLNVIDFFSMTNVGVVVTTPEPTSIINAYEFLKNVIYRIFFRLFRHQEEILNIIRAGAHPNAPNGGLFKSLMEEIAQVNPWAAQTAQEICASLRFYLLFNQARNLDELELAKKLNHICERYLGLTLNVMGIVYHNEEVSASVTRMTPLSIAAPESITTRSIKSHAHRILEHLVKVKNDPTYKESFDMQFSHVLAQAKHDYVENHLIQKQIKADRLKRDEMRIL